MDMDKLHAAIRREVCASDRLRMMERAYKDNPTDGMAREFHRAWVEMRESVDALVAIKAEDDESVSLAG